MPAGLKRYYGQGDLHFVTFSCYRRLSLLKTARVRERFVRELDKVRKETGFHLIGYVVMPNHVHLLMSEPQVGTPSSVLQKLKRRFSQQMRKGRGPASVGRTQPQDPGYKPNLGHPRLPFEERDEPLRAFWQPRFYDFNVYTRGKRREKLNYMHANPVIRGLVKHPKDWLWSSWSFHEKGEAGLIRIDAE